MAINIENYKTNDFSQDCDYLSNLDRKYINFDQLRKDLWSQLRSVDAYDDKKNILIEIIDVTHYNYDDVENLFCEIREKIFESLLILINENFLRINFNDKKFYFKFKLIFCNGRRENVKAYDNLRIKIDSILRPFGKSYIKIINNSNITENSIIQL